MDNTTHFKPTNMDEVPSIVKVVETPKRVKSIDIMLRILVFILTFIAAVVVGVDKETKIVTITIIKTLPPVHVPAIAKWQYLSAFMYFLVANVVACAYAAVSSAYSMANRRLKSNSELALILIDVTMVGLLFSATGAAMAVGVIGMKGNSHVQWNKVCNVFGDFCRHVEAALALSLFGSFVFLSLVVLAILNLHKRSR